MINGILWAVGAGIMLGLYALPEKYIKGYKYENTWFLFFFLAFFMFIPVDLSPAFPYEEVLSQPQSYQPVSICADSVSDKP